VRSKSVRTDPSGPGVSRHRLTLVATIPLTQENVVAKPNYHQARKQGGNWRGRRVSRKSKHRRNLAREVAATSGRSVTLYFPEFGRELAQRILPLRLFSVHPRQALTALVRTEWRPATRIPGSKAPKVPPRRS